MIQIDIPGFRKVTIRHIVADHNGTLACEGELLDGVAEGFRRLAERVAIHVVTADTFGLAAPVFRTFYKKCCKSLILLTEYFENGCCKRIFKHVFT